MNSDWKRLIKNVSGLIIIGAVAFAVYYFLFRPKDDSLKISDTPIHIESVRTIAELSTVSYKDEVVMDTVEFYNDDHAIYDPRSWIQMYDRNIKRRLTLIVKGEVHYGLDLTNGNYRIENDTDTLVIHLPNPKILDVIVSPSRTEVFQEQGEWDDKTRTRLEENARLKLKSNAKSMKLEERAKENAEKMFDRLLQTEKKIIIIFDHD